jgi:hypothetical protein
MGLGNIQPAVSSIASPIDSAPKKGDIVLNVVNNSATTSGCSGRFSTVISSALKGVQTLISAIVARIFNILACIPLIGRFIKPVEASVHNTSGVVKSETMANDSTSKPATQMTPQQIAKKIADAAVEVVKEHTLHPTPSKMPDVIDGVANTKPLDSTQDPASSQALNVSVIIEKTPPQSPTQVKKATPPRQLFPDGFQPDGVTQSVPQSTSQELLPFIQVISGDGSEEEKRTAVALLSPRAKQTLVETANAIENDSAPADGSPATTYNPDSWQGRLQGMMKTAAPYVRVFLEVASHASNH